MLISLFGLLAGLVLLGVSALLYLRLRAHRWRPLLLVGALAGLALLLPALWNTGVFVPTPLAQQASTTPPSRPPAALVTAQDFLAQGDYEFDRGNYDAAIAAYSRAIELNPNSAEAYNNRAYALMTRQDYAPALDDLNRAITLRPNYVNALMNRGDIHNYYYQVDFDSAITDYDRVIALGGMGSTSVCGHRMLAQHHGWDPTIYFDILLHGVDVGCEGANPT